MRRPNGSGTIKLLDKRRRKRYAVYAPAIMDYENRKIIQRLIGTFATRQEAEQALLDYSPYNFEVSKLTFKQVYNNWLNTVKDDIKKSSFNNYVAAYNKNLKKYDDFIFKDLNMIFWQNEIKEGNINSNAKKILGMIYGFAVKYEIVNKNIISFLKTPKTERQVIRKEFTKEEIELLKKLSDTDDMAKYLYILIHTGLRIGEFLNLRKDDIIDNKFIRVRESKTKSGENRIIPIHKNIEKYFFTNKNDDYIFFNVKYRSYMKFYRYFSIFNEKYFQNSHTIHDTRHTFATLLTRNGVNEAVIISMIGHSNIKITNDFYVHANKEDMEKAINFIS